MLKQFLLLQKNSGKTRSDASGKWKRFLTNSIHNGTVPSPVAFTEDYRFSMRILNKHTEPPFCHYGFCPAIHISPLFCQPQSCLPLLVISISKLCTHLQTYLKLYLSILILCIATSLLDHYTAYLSNPFPDYDLTYQHYPNHILILCINPILAYYISSYFYPAHFKRYSSFFTLSQI